MDVAFGPDSRRLPMVGFKRFSAIHLRHPSCGIALFPSRRKKLDRRGALGFVSTITSRFWSAVLLQQRGVYTSARPDDSPFVFKGSTLKPQWGRVFAAQHPKEEEGNGSSKGWTITTTRGMASAKTKEQPRGSLWRTRSVISKETVQAVHDLKRKKGDSAELERVFETRIPRLLKMDLLATLSELQRQNEIELALRVFDVVRNEMWYKPDQFLYRAMIDALGRSRKIAEIEKKFQELQDEGIKPGVPIYRELVGAYVRAHLLPRALEVHSKMVEAGFGDDPLSLRFIEIGKEKEAVRMKQRKKAGEKLMAEADPEEASH